MKRFINPNKTNYYKEVLSSFSEDSKLMFTGLVKSFTEKRYKWIADYLFKHRTNFATNPHRAFVAFFSNKEIVHQEYGNLSDVYTHYKFLQTYERQKIPLSSYELSSKQYNKIGQKYTEFDLIEFINASGKEWSKTGDLSINHRYKDNPLFHAEGYKIEGYPNNITKFIWVNSGYFLPELNLSNFIIHLGLIYSGVVYPSPQHTEIFSTPHGLVTRVFDYKIQINHKNFFYFNNSSEWVVYHAKTDFFNGNDKKPYFGALVCYNEKNEEISPLTVRYFPDVLVNNKVEMSKIIITWSTPVSGKCAFYPGNVYGILDDQSRILFHSCKYMFNNIGDGKIRLAKKVGTDIIYDGIDLETERNKCHYATVITEPYFSTKAINNGTVVNYKFIDRNNNNVNYADETSYINQPGMYLKLKCNSDMIREIDRLLTLEEYNTDIIDTLIIKNPRTVLPVSPVLYYQNFNEDDNTFYQRQDDGIYDLLYGRYGDPAAKHEKFTINKYSPRQDNYENSMKVAGIGFYTETEIDSITGNIIGDTEYLSIYCNNYSFNIFESVTFMNNASSSTVTRVERYEKFKPLLKLNGINGYIKILKKNKHFQIVKTTDGQYEVVYNIEFPYCPGSHSERYKMNFSGGYKLTQILYKDSYISTGDSAVYSSTELVSNFTNERYELLKDDAFTYMNFSGSGDSIETAWFENNGGYLNGRILKSTINYPSNRTQLEIKPSMISAEVSGLTDVYKAYNYQIILNTSPAKYDYQLLLLIDNKKWSFDNRYEPYINRENPSYICEIDVSSLYNDYTKYQKNHDAIPDLKRWLYEYVKSFAHVSIGNEIIDSTISRSDIMIDIWDQKSLVGTNRKGNWRSISPSQLDTDKVEGLLIIDNLYRFDTGTEITGTGFWTFKFGYKDPTHFNEFPSYFKPADYDNTTNKILYDSYNKKCYHIAFVKYLSEITPGGPEGFEFTIKWISGTDPLPDNDKYIEFAYPRNFINRFKDFELYSSRVITATDCKLVNKFIDIRKTGSLTDYDRYIDSNKKIYFRIRVNRNKEYPITKYDIDNDNLQYITEIDPGATWTNNPWKVIDGPTYKWVSIFDWRRVNFIENVVKLGMTYFRCTSQ